MYLLTNLIFRGNITFVGNNLNNKLILICLFATICILGHVGIDSNIFRLNYFQF